MKRINFKSIKIQNLLSIGNDPIQINFKKGINFITGINKDKNNRRNGTGKSTILTGIFWGLFGENDRNIKNEFLINNITKNKTCVEIDFDVIKNSESNSYKIIRTLKPSSCLLYENGKDITLSSIANTNLKIIEIISSTPEMFQNCSIMSLNDTIPFMAKKEIDKRKFIEQIFNLEFFNKMLLDIRNDFNNKKKEKDIQDVVLNEKQILLKSNIIQKENYDSKISQNIAKLKRKLKDIDDTIKRFQKEEIHIKNHDFNNELETYEKIKNEEKQKIESNNKKILDLKNNNNLKNIDLLNNKLSELNIQKNENNKQLSELHKKINDINANIIIEEKILQNISQFKEGDLCPTCQNKIIDKNFEHLEKIKIEKNTLLKKLNNVKKNLLEKNDLLIKQNEENDRNIEKINNEINKINNLTIDINNNILTLKEENNKIDNNINNIEKNINEILLRKQKIILEIDDLNNKINKLYESKIEINNELKNKEINPFDEIIEKIKLEINECNKQNIKLKEELNILNDAKFIVSEEGVKSYILKQVLEVFNNKLLEYLKKLQSNCICTFNEFFEEQILNEKGIPCSYFNFSGAERKSIDLACLFTFIDMRRLLNNVSYNLSIYDEIIDTSFDEKGVELVLDIIKNNVEKNNEACYIISHRKECSNFVSGEIIELVKENGITKQIKNV